MLRFVYFEHIIIVWSKHTIMEQIMPSWSSHVEIKSLPQNHIIYCCNQTTGIVCAFLLKMSAVKLIYPLPWNDSILCVIDRFNVKGSPNIILLYENSDDSSVTFIDIQTQHWFTNTTIKLFNKQVADPLCYITYKVVNLNAWCSSSRHMHSPLLFIVSKSIHNGSHHISSISS